MGDAAIGSEIQQFLTFLLGDEVYAFDVSHVREILEVIPITRVPRTPEYLRGVINNRGSVIPVLDVKRKFGLGKTEKGVNTCIIVAELQVGNDPITVGVLSDSVQEVVELDAGQIQPPPRVGSGQGAEFLLGIGKKDDRFIMIMDINHLFSVQELSAAEATGAL
jgi:purine-binding chemotaxis protein CheW